MNPLDDPLNPRQPIEDFLRAVYADLDEDGPESHEGHVFQLVRALKAHADVKHLAAEEAYAKVSALAGRRTRPVRPTSFDLLSMDCEVAFHDLWGRVRFALGTDPVEVAAELAGSGHLGSGVKRPGKYGRFLTIAAFLQIQVRDRPILLPVRKLAKHVPCGPNSVTVWIRWAIEDGVLVRTAAHAFRTGGESRAAEYVFGLHCWEKNVIDGLAARLHVRVTWKDLAWTRGQFPGEQRACTRRGGDSHY